MIKDKVMMMALTVTKPQLTKTDKMGTAAAEDALNAKGAGKYVKALYPKHLIDPIVQVEAEARAFMYARTRMWIKGLYLLPSTQYFAMAEQMGKYQLQHGQVVTAFLSNISRVLHDAQQAQGAMFNASEYPDVASLREQFSFNPRYFPFAESGDFALDMDENELQELKDQAAEQYKAAFAESNKDLYSRLYKAVLRIVTQTSKDKGRIYDTLTDDIAELVQTLPSLNFNNDATLDELIDQCRSLAVDPDALRAMPEVKDRVCDDAKAILARMAGFM